MPDKLKTEFDCPVCPVKVKVPKETPGVVCVCGTVVGRDGIITRVGDGSKEVSEEVLNYRESKCHKCPYYRQTNHCVKISQGCSVSYQSNIKVRSGKCPEGEWDSVE